VTSARKCVTGRAPGLCTASLDSHTPGSRWHRGCSCRGALQRTAQPEGAVRARAPLAGTAQPTGGPQAGQGTPAEPAGALADAGAGPLRRQASSGHQAPRLQAAGCLWAAPGAAGGRVPVGRVIGACPPSRTAQPARSGTAGWFGRARDCLYAPCQAGSLLKRQVAPCAALSLSSAAPGGAHEGRPCSLPGRGGAAQPFAQLPWHAAAHSRPRGLRARSPLRLCCNTVPVL